MLEFLRYSDTIFRFKSRVLTSADKKYLMLQPTMYRMLHGRNFGKGKCISFRFKMICGQKEDKRI